MVASRDEADGVRERLRLLSVAKDLFLSDWYLVSAEEMFGPEELPLLRRIAVESREELEDTLPLVRRWGENAAGQRLREAPAAVAGVARRDFLTLLIEAKDASGEVYERAAFLAPPHLKDEFLRLAAIDFRHAIELRTLLAREYERSIGDRQPAREA